MPRLQQCELAFGNAQMQLDEQLGAIVSLTAFDKEFILGNVSSRRLFSLRLRDRNGVPYDVSSGTAQEWSADSTAGYIRLHYRGLGGLELDATAEAEAKGDELHWHIAVQNRTDLSLEWIDYPEIIVPNDLIGAGGDARLVWPAMEGVLIDDVNIRESTWLHYKEPGYPSKGWEGVYPGPAPTQFMAYYGEKGGLYVGAHDPYGHVKSIEYLPCEGGIKLQFRLFCEGAGRGTYRMGYPMVLATFKGDWHDAADRYRSWFESSDVPKPTKLANNNKLPDWYFESPVIVTYPVRGGKDTGDMTENEYFPYIEAMPLLERFAEAFGSKVMALLMHWEGSAPWAPPYVWPPFGGKERLKIFADALHGKGHLLGLYCSGIAWTQESLLVPEYGQQDRFEREHLEEIMCRAPDGSLPYSLICGGSQRWGFDMCPSQPFVETTVTREIRGMLESDCDYIQFFDQNLGGMSYFCYDPSHGHGPGPGRWQTEAMRHLFRSVNRELEQSGRKVVLGCEAAAAEPFLSELPLNDLRFNVGYFMGRPIPLYQYVYHEYVNNFMGNQNMVVHTIDFEQSPDNLLWRLAYSFLAGDMLTVVLGRGGRINWDWGSDPVNNLPDQSAAERFIHTLNGWRKGAGRDYLHFGKMIKPLSYTCEGVHTVCMKDGRKLEHPAVLTSKWGIADGRQAQFFVNVTASEQSFKVQLEKQAGAHIAVSIDGTASGEFIQLEADDQDQLPLKVEEYGVLMILEQ
ncbi:DUF6259 domain-containing protein [Cohnella silvisoli]|uniref:DUF6259 domain-containing protein n=1 Tax=Cohnella silvisoli TaxID=2873699 RepID=A0ABV1KWA7_9BACL|nr:DUF6259 domain-containing protein [Cohnella silvisoli]MCD9023733.1 DUF6259 domain-containing protein [Cohnella silvisoli]